MRVGRLSSLFAVVVASGVFGRVVEASPIFIQNPVVNQGVSSDFATTFRAADNFALASADVVRSVLWRGFYVLSNTPQAIDLFTINFYADSAGLPGALLSSTNVTAVNRIDTGTNVAGFNIYEYTANVGGLGFSALAGTNYWFSVVNDTTLDTNDNWFWMYLNTSSTLAQFNPSALWFSSPGASYFTLDNAALQDPTAVPEPASMVLFGTGLIGMITVRMRRRK